MSSAAGDPIESPSSTCFFLGLRGGGDATRAAVVNCGLGGEASSWGGSSPADDRGMATEEGVERRGRVQEGEEEEETGDTEAAFGVVST